MPSDEVVRRNQCRGVCGHGLWATWGLVVVTVTRFVKSLNSVLTPNSPTINQDRTLVCVPARGGGGPARRKHVPVSRE